MSYLSKSKNTSVRAATGAKSCTAGRAVVVGAGVAVPPVAPPLCICCGPPDGAAVLVAAPVGAGAAACVVAGRFAQPLRATAATSRNEDARCEQRGSRTPPFGVRLKKRVNDKETITAVEATTRDLSPRRARA